MAYSHRIIKTGATYYVTSRCINFEPYLGTDIIKDIVEKCIIKTQARYSFEVTSFGIMDNQLRIMIRTTDERYTISRILQLMKSMITRDVNRKTFRTGTIWNERFSSEIVETVEENIDDLMTIILYTMYNPSLSTEEGNPRKNRYNSIYAYTGEGHPSAVMISPHPYIKKLWKTTDGFFSGFRYFEKWKFQCC